MKAIINNPIWRKGPDIRMIRSKKETKEIEDMIKRDFPGKMKIEL